MNRLSTDTLTFSDIQNKAEYEASSVGVSYSSKSDKENNVTKGVTPNIGVTASGDADSTTQSAISPGAIEVRSDPDMDLSKLSRDPTSTVNNLARIFDKKTVQEQQELARLFGEEAFKLVHKISEANGWEEGSPQKIALHAFVGAVMADLGGGNVLSGAVGAGINEAIQKELADRFEDHPDLHQWASFIVGAAAASAVGGDALTGGSTAASGTKNNWQSGTKVSWAKKVLEETSDRNPVTGVYDGLYYLSGEDSVEPGHSDLIFNASIQLGYFTDRDIAIMIIGDIYVDRPSNFFNSTDHCEPGFEYLAARRSEELFGSAIVAENTGRHNEAMYLLGQAMHTAPQDYWSHTARGEDGKLLAHLDTDVNGVPLPDSVFNKPEFFENAGNDTYLWLAAFLRQTRRIQ